MTGSNVVVVESPAKAKTINKYLGADYMVLASFGHVRDLPPKDGSVRPDEDFAMDWELGERSRRHIDAIVTAAKGARCLWLATDPDREGEAIAWHVQELLKQKKLLGTLEVRRITFHEITRAAVTAALRQPRDVNRELVDAYLARRALDYLVGFTLSPVLWRKLPGSRSAGRVQSVALRLICEREAEIEDFRTQEFWTIEGQFRTAQGAMVPARLTHLDGVKLDKFTLGNEGAAQAVLDRLRPLPFHVESIERKQVKRHPWPPFTTSTLQQEASRKLGFGASRTMRLAQKLYEGVDIGGETVGLITYMRTDGVQLAQEAIASARTLIAQHWGDRYVPESPRVYKSTAKNAQEAHEAIRPTDLARRPDDVAPYLDRDELRLYELVWKRTLACQMASAELDQVAVDIASPKKEGVLRATGSVVRFDGFLRVYKEDRDDEGDDDGDTRLPPMNLQEALSTQALEGEQHHTQPPPRYTEASLVKRMEELGIGRPSTYASILEVLQERKYVRLDKKRFVPEDRGRLVTAFLENFFRRYVEYNFTADLENQLDDISGGRVDWKAVLRQFWTAFSASIEGTKDLTITQVIDALDEELGPHFFPAPTEGGADPRVCPACTAGRLGLRLSRNGAFIGCSRYPDCRYTRPLTVGGGNGEEGGAMDLLAEGPRLLGLDPDTGLPVTVRRGPYGTYIQLGPAPVPPVAASPSEPESEAGASAAEDGKGKAKPKTKPKKKAAAKEEKPKRVSLPKTLTAAEVDLDTGLRLLALPREIGPHPSSGEMISAGIGRFGPYLKCGPTYRNLPEDEDVLAVGINRAVVLMADAKQRKAAAPGRSLGEHPDDGKAISVGTGRFGPYVRHGSVYATIPRGADPEAVTLDEALVLLAAKVTRSAEGAGTSKLAPKMATKAAGKAEALKAAPKVTSKGGAKPAAKGAVKSPSPASSPKSAARSRAAAVSSKDESPSAAATKRKNPATKASVSSSGTATPSRGEGAAPARARRKTTAG